MGNIYAGANNIARDVKSIYGGVNGVAREVKKVYAGVNGVAKLIWKKTSGAILPDAYQQVEYVENDSNKNAYINTGYTPLVNNANNNVEIKMTFSWSTLPSSAQNVFGTRYSSTRFGFGKDGSHHWRFGYGSFTSSSTSSRTAKDVKYDVDAYYSYGSQWLEAKDPTDTTYNREVTKTETTAFNASNSPFYIFRFNYSTPEASHMKLYSCKIYANGILQRNFYPCYEKATGTVGVYDLVGREFYTNANSNGSLTAGPNYEQQL